MKRYYYNNRLAKVLLCCSTCHTIALAWFVLSKRSKEQTSQTARNHETIHSVQWTEITIAAGAILFALVVGLDISSWWTLVAPFVYYLWYVVEWLIRLPFGNAYRSISFEMEAYTHDEDCNYVENRRMFTGWLVQIFKS